MKEKFTFDLNLISELAPLQVGGGEQGGGGGVQGKGVQPSQRPRHL